MNTFFEQILIGSKFDAKGFKQAETAADKLGKNVKNLAKSFGLAFGTAQVIAFGKAAVRAAAADEKAQKQLALALKNVGLGRDALLQKPTSSDYKASSALLMISFALLIRL